MGQGFGEDGRMSTWDEARWLSDNEPIPGHPRSLDELCSPEYRAQLKSIGWSKGGSKFVTEIVSLARTTKSLTVLDYGCGPTNLAETSRRFFPDHRLSFSSYDPGIPGKDTLPQPADLVVCTDVLEHVEPDKIDAVLSHLFHLARRAAFVVIALRPAEKRLPDGRNAHLIIDNAVWWCDKLKAAGDWKLAPQPGGEGELKLWLKQQR
jgi:hypothetical protein